MNDQIERQEHPNATAGRRTGHGSDTVDTRHRRRSSTHVVESPSKAVGHSVTLALDADSTAANLGYYRSKNLTGGNEEAALPQREETLQPHSRDNRRMGDKKRPHITPPLTPDSPATLPNRKRTEEGSDCKKTARGIAQPKAVTANPWRAS